MYSYSPLKKYGYLWVTLAIFLVSLFLHWYFAWDAYAMEQLSEGKSLDVSEYVVSTLRDTFENWQSEFLQLIWQVAGLAYLWYLGSPQSKEGDDRKEAKLDYIIRHMEGKKGEKIISELDIQYPRG